MEAKPKKKRDPYRNLKWFGYKMAVAPISGPELVNFARFHLAKKTNRLLKDPIWDQYTREELMVEFYAHNFVDNPNQFKEKFESEIGDVFGEVDDFSVWADKEMAKEAKIRDETLNGMEDRVAFDPKNIMGDDE